MLTEVKAIRNLVAVVQVYSEDKKKRTCVYAYEYTTRNLSYPPFIVLILNTNTLSMVWEDKTMMDQGFWWYKKHDNTYTIAYITKDQHVLFSGISSRYSLEDCTNTGSFTNPVNPTLVYMEIVPQ